MVPHAFWLVCMAEAAVVWHAHAPITQLMALRVYHGTAPDSF